jgi:hypothetical protein
VSGGSSQCERLWLEHELTETPLQIPTGEAPGERFAKRGVAPTELDDAVCQLVQAGAVIRSEHLALDNRRVNFDLVEPARMSRWFIMSSTSRPKAALPVFGSQLWFVTLRLQPLGSAAV